MSTDYYRKLLIDETAYFNDRITKFTAVLDGLTGDNVDGITTPTAASAELIESVIGRIRLAIGQSNLFINERFKQFSGLIDDCELKRGEKEIKVDDLAGFWDMIYYQVEDLKAKYAVLEEMERNDWVEEKKVNEEIQEIPEVKVTKQRNGKTSSHVTAPISNGGTTAAAPGKKPTGRSNFREFLKSKRKEVPAVNGLTTTTEPILEMAVNGSPVTTTNGALANGTAHHLNGRLKNGLHNGSSTPKENGTCKTNGHNGLNGHAHNGHAHNGINGHAHHHLMSTDSLEIQKLKNLTETLSLLHTSVTPMDDETNKEN